MTFFEVRSCPATKGEKAGHWKGGELMVFCLLDKLDVFEDFGDLHDFQELEVFEDFCEFADFGEVEDFEDFEDFQVCVDCQDWECFQDFWFLEILKFGKFGSF